MRRYVALGLALAAGGGGVAAAASAGHAAGAAGGLSVSPAILQQRAAAGPLAPVTVVNRSARRLDVTVAARPWLQSSDGQVEPDRRHALAGVSVDAPSFTLAPGETRAVGLTVTAVPAAGALYGALEVVGLAPGAQKAKGVVLGYRLIGTLRLTPAVAVHKLTGRLRARGRTIELAVANRGNTVDPVSGEATVKDPRGTRTPGIDDVRILPGKTVRLRLVKGLRPGSYRVSARLEQARKTVVRVTKRLRVR